MRLMQKKSGWAFLLFLWYCNSIWICDDLDLTKCLFLFYDTFLFFIEDQFLYMYSKYRYTDISEIHDFTISWQFCLILFFEAILNFSHMTSEQQLLKPGLRESRRIHCSAGFLPGICPFFFFNDCAWDPFHAWLCLFIGVNRAGCCYN